MKRGIITVILAFAVCSFINGQVDYKSRGMAYVAKGNYVDAQSQFEAAKTVLKSKKVNQNAPEFIDIEKKILYAKQCQTFSKQATSALNELTDAAIKDAFAQCNNELDADRAQESLLSTLEKAQSALSNIRNKFSSDEVTKANLDKCAEIKSKITDFRDGFSAALLLSFSDSTTAQNARTKASAALMRGEYNESIQLYELAATTAETVDERDLNYAEASKIRQIVLLVGKGIKQYNDDRLDDAEQTFNKVKGLYAQDANAQRYMKLINERRISPKVETNKAESVKSDIVEIPPKFNGAESNTFANWVNSVMVYPEEAREHGISGRVVLSFVVDVDGSIVDVRVLRGVDPVLDNEAVRIVSSSPKWSPGIQDGKKVRVQYTFPVIFALL